MKYVDESRIKTLDQVIKEFGKYQVHWVDNLNKIRSYMTNPSERECALLSEVDNESTWGIIQNRKGPRNELNQIGVEIYSKFIIKRF